MHLKFRMVSLANLSPFVSCTWQDRQWEWVGLGAQVIWYNIFTHSVMQKQHTLRFALLAASLALGGDSPGPGCPSSLRASLTRSQLLCFARIFDATNCPHQGGAPFSDSPPLSHESDCLTLARPVMWLLRYVTALNEAAARDFHHSSSWALLAVSDRHTRSDSMPLALQKDCDPGHVFGGVRPPLYRKRSHTVRATLPSQIEWSNAAQIYTGLHTVDLTYQALLALKMHRSLSKVGTRDLETPLRPPTLGRSAYNRPL